MGTVYRALDPVIDRTVAIKTISTQQAGVDAALVERLLMEARSAGRLHHSNIVTIFDFGHADDIAYIVMELVEGVDLGRLIAENHPLALPQKIDLLLQICAGLGYAHDRGVTHRDMKPSNVRITEDGTAKILDFGLARFDDTQLTKSGFISGTIAYMSPERINGQTGKSDDIFALGASAYELLTYRRAFPGSSTPEVMFKILTEPPPAPSSIAELPPDLDAVLLKCVAREAGDRYGSAHDFAAAVEEAFESDASQAFVTDSSRSQEFRASLLHWSPRRRTRDTRSRPFGSATASGATPTKLFQTDGTPSASAMTLPGVPSDATVTSQPMAAPATEIVRQPRRKYFGVAVAAAFITALVAAGALFLRRPESTAPVTTTQKAAITTASASVAASTETSTAASETVSTMELTAPISSPPKPATETVAPRPVPQPRKPEPAPKRPEPEPQNPEPRKDPEPTPVPVPVPPPPTPAPTPQPEPQPQPASDPREEISSFMRRVANAYETRDVAFFRENHLGFTEAMGNGVRNSPSTNVRLLIVSISVENPNRASVVVERTDQLPGGAPPAKQRLTYALERAGGEWKIRRFGRS